MTNTLLQKVFGDGDDEPCVENIVPKKLPTKSPVPAKKGNTGGTKGDNVGPESDVKSEGDPAARNEGACSDSEPDAEHDSYWGGS